MTNYLTPTTEDVRRQIQDGAQSSGAIDRDSFDRWLAEHDRDTAERAWEGGCSTGWDGAIRSVSGNDSDELINPFALT